jgi:hypothetical protein
MKTMKSLIAMTRPVGFSGLAGTRARQRTASTH